MGGILLFFLLIILLFSIPSVQTFLGDKATNFLNKTYDVAISVERIGLTYSGKVDLQNVLIRDHHRDTLIHAEQINTSLLSIASLKQGQPDLGAVTIDHLYFNMKLYKDEESDNLMTFVRKFNASKKVKRKFVLTAAQLFITNGHFIYSSERLDTPKVLDFSEIEMEAEALKIDGVDFYLKINDLASVDHRGLKIDYFETDMVISPTCMDFSNLVVETSSSMLKGDVQFDYKVGDMADFLNKVQIQASFTNSKINTNDLIPFYKGFGRNQKFAIQNLVLKGVMNNFRLSRVRISGMDRSVIRGNMILSQVFSEKAKDFKLTADFKKLHTNYYDLINFMPQVLGKSLPKQLRTFGNISAVGNSIVSRKGLDIDMDISSHLGKVSAFLILGNLDNALDATYNGNLIVHQFNLGALLEKKSLGFTTFNLDVDGRGFTRANLDTQLEGTIQNLDFNGYSYNSIKVKGILKDPIFDGQLVSNDPDFKLRFNGVADLSSEINNYDFEADVEFVDLNHLNIFKRDSVAQFKGGVVMKMKGTSFNDAFGTISFSETSYLNQNDDYYFDDFEITSTFAEDGVRTITANSPDIVQGTVKGIFKFENVYDLFRNAIGSLYTNFEAINQTDNEFMEFDFTIYNKIVDVFFPQIKFGPNTFIRGKVESDQSEFKLTFKSPEIKIFDNLMRRINVQVDNKNPLFNTYIAIDSIATKNYDVSKFSMINVTLKDTLFMRSEFYGGSKKEDKFNLSFFHTINQNNKSVIGIRKSDILFKGNTWYINEKNDRYNKVVFDNRFKDVRFDSLVLNHNDEEIRLAGTLKDTSYKNVKVNFKNVLLNHITPDIKGLELSGLVNGKLDILQENGAYYPNSSLEIKNLGANEISLGLLQVDVIGNETLTQYGVNTVLTNNAVETLKGIGAIAITDDGSDIDLDITLDSFDLQAFSPLGKNIIQNIRGLVSGEAQIKGDYKNPDINGLVTLNKAGLKIPYLNVDFDFEEKAKVRLSNQLFNFDNIAVTTTKHNTRGTLNGFIKHQNFKKWELDLDISSDRLLVLDTKDDEDVLYYGTAFIDGRATIKGPTDALVIDVAATSEKGTEFKIPLNDIETIGDNNYIHFLSPQEKKARMSGKEVIIEEVKGLELNFDLDLNNNAEVEIVVDKATGSSLKGRGAGTLLIEINTNGKFNMWGDFVAYQGVYNFRYGAFLEKIFKVRQGGSINWEGSPTGAILDMSAVYQTEANPGILLENQPTNRKIPVDVIIDLQGELLKPDLSFQVEFPKTSSIVKSELQYRMNDRNERERQALSLVSQGRFLSEASLGQGELITGNLVERASSLVNDIFSDDEDKFQVGLDYVQGDRNPITQNTEAAGRFGVSVSTQINDRILINGKVGVPVGGVSESVIVGDVEIQFLLNEDGSLRANIFNRQNDIQFIGAGEADGYTQGVGLSYTYDFDTFKELIRKIFKNKDKKNLPKNKQATTGKSSETPSVVKFK